MSKAIAPWSNAASLLSPQTAHDRFVADPVASEPGADVIALAQEQSLSERRPTRLLLVLGEPLVGLGDDDLFYREAGAPKPGLRTTFRSWIATSATSCSSLSA